MEAPHDTESPKAPQKLPSAWGAPDSDAHKATGPDKKKAGGLATTWANSSDSMSSQQKVQAANSKLQPSAASFKAKKSTSKVPWVETGIDCGHQP